MFLSLLLWTCATAQYTCRNAKCEKDPQFAYTDLCAKRQAERQQSDDVVIFQWTPPMLDIFHSRAGRLRCTDPNKPDCDIDDDWTATFQRACKTGGVPCLLDDVAPASETASRAYGYLGPQCRTWGLKGQCSVIEDVADMTAEKILSADVILFQGTNNRVWGQGVYPPYKCDGQIWAMWEFRPASVYPFLRDEQYLKSFDITVGYSRNWTIATPDFVPTPHFYKHITKDRSAINPVMAMISQCNTPNNRIAYLEELMKHIGVDSFGKCLHNKELPADILEMKNKYSQKAAILQRYKFAIAFENSNEPDYVSEKIYNALSEGVIPIYMGAPNVAEYAPAGSYIDTADFESPAALAQRLHALLNDDAAFDAYLTWKRAPPPPHMLALERNSTTYHLCRICDYAQRQRVRAQRAHHSDL